MRISVIASSKCNEEICYKVNSDDVSWILSQNCWKNWSNIPSQGKKIDRLLHQWSTSWEAPQHVLYVCGVLSSATILNIDKFHIFFISPLKFLWSRREALKTRNNFNFLLFIEFILRLKEKFNVPNPHPSSESCVSATQCVRHSEFKCELPATKYLSMTLHATIQLINLLHFYQRVIDFFPFFFHQSTFKRKKKDYYGISSALGVEQAWILIISFIRISTLETFKFFVNVTKNGSVHYFWA